MISKPSKPPRPTYLITYKQPGGRKPPTRKEIKNMTAKEIIENNLYEAAVNLMDDELRESIHAEIAPCTDEEFLTRYMDEHEKKYGEKFTV